MRASHIVMAGFIILLFENNAYGGEQPQSNIIYSLSNENPRMRFHEGDIENNQPKILLDEPNIKGPRSEWYVAQWQQKSYLSAGNMVENPTDTLQSGLGVAKYAFNAQDRHSHVWIYKQDNIWIYDLFERNGTLSALGGSNLFLTDNVTKPNARFEKDIWLSISVKLSAAQRVPMTDVADSSDALLSQVFTGFGLLFTDPVLHASQLVFMQLPISSSRTMVNKGFKTCSMMGNKPHLLYIPKYDDGEQMLPYQVNAKPPQKFLYHLNSYVTQLVNNSYECSGATYSWPESSHELKNWSITFVYIGIESQAQDGRIAANTKMPQGQISTGLQISDLSVYKTD